MGYFCSGIIYSFYFFILFILVCFFICWETEKTPTCKQTGVLRFFLFCSVDLTPQHTCKQACVRAHTHTPHTQTYFCYIVFFYVSNLLWLETLASVSETLRQILQLRPAEAWRWGTQGPRRGEALVERGTHSHYPQREENNSTCCQKENQNASLLFV